MVAPVSEAAEVSSSSGPRRAVAGQPGRRGAAARHAAAAGIAGLVLLATAVGTTALLAVAAREPQRTGALVAFFPPGWGDTDLLVAAAQADAALKASGRVPGLIEVTSDRPGLADRLVEAGAWLVLVPPPAHLLTLGGCAGTTPLPDGARRGPLHPL